MIYLHWLTIIKYKINYEKYKLIQIEHSDIFGIIDISYAIPLCK